VLISLKASESSAIFMVESFVNVNRMTRIKFKMVNGQLALKMRSGSYLQLSRLGPYFPELCLGPKFGLSYIATE